MQFFNFEFIAQIAGVLSLIAVTGIGVVPLTNFLKGVLKLDGNAAKWLSVAVSLVLGVAEAIAAGEITGEQFTLEGLAALVTAVWFVSQNFYKEHFSNGVS